MKVNHPSVSKLKKKLWPLFSQYIRMRDCLKTTRTKDMGKCICCGRIVGIHECDAGHYISRSRTATLYDERNVNLQCKPCNRFPDGITFDKYKKALIKKYGEGIIIELEETAKDSKKFTPSELTELIETYKNKIKELEK